MEKTASEQIDDIEKMYDPWKGTILAQVRNVIHAADPDIVEEIKWKMRSRPEGLPVWSHNGIVCRMETFKDNEKLVFSKGAFLKDSHKLFNARLQASTDRAIEFKEGDSVNEAALSALIKEAVAFNTSKK